MNSTSLCVFEDGTVRCLCTELIDLAAFGTLKIQRVSTIAFDNSAQVWRVFNRQGRCVYSSPSRAHCLRWEQEYVSSQGDSTASPSG